jgi:hypothetical protein
MHPVPSAALSEGDVRLQFVQDNKSFCGSKCFIFKGTRQGGEINLYTTFTPYTLHPYFILSLCKNNKKTNKNSSFFKCIGRGGFSHP